MNAELTPAEVEALAALPSLEQLKIDWTNRKSAAIPKFEDYRSVALPPGAMRRIFSTHAMRSLSLEGCLLSEDDLRAIAEEHSLIFVSLGCPAAVDDRALHSLLSLPCLSTLYINGAPATGEGLANHPGSKTLTAFCSTETPLGEDFAVFMANCPKLRVANLFDAKTTVEFTRRLENHPSLEQLMLARGGLTEASIDSLLTMPRLTLLAVPQGALTPEVQARVAKRRPDLIVRPTSN
jgi:hypothetical protein